MPAQGPNTGGNMKLYRNTGTYAIPVWVLMAEIGDVNIPDLARTMAEMKRRSSQFAVNFAALIQTISIEFKQWHGLDATNFTAMKTNFFAGTAEEWGLFDTLVATSGSQGLRCPVLIAEWPWQQNLEDVSDHDLVAKTAYWESPAGTAVNPTWYVAP